MPLFGNKSSADESDAQSSLEPGDVAAPEIASPVSDDSGGVSDPENDAGSGDVEGDDASVAQDNESGSEATSPEDDDEGPPHEDMDDDLMSIFTSEEEEDEELSALTVGLEDVDAAALLTQARELADRLRSAHGQG